MVSNLNRQVFDGQLLARVYTLILSWPDPDENETDGSKNLGEDTEQTDTKDLPVKITPTDL